MGLVVKTIPTGGVLVSTGSTHGPGYGVVQTGYALTSNTSSDLFSDVNSFDTSIYRILSMQDDMKTVAIQGTISNEFELFLKYATDLSLGNQMSEGFIAFNNYLGSLGV